MMESVSLGELYRLVSEGLSSELVDLIPQGSTPAEAGEGDIWRREYGDLLTMASGYIVPIIINNMTQCWQSMETSEQDINQTDYSWTAVEFDQEQIIDSFFTHSGSCFYAKIPGWYRVNYCVSYYDTDGNQRNIQTAVRKNGDDSTTSLWVTPVMTSNNTPSPYVASATSEYSSSYKAYGGFRQTTADHYCWLSSEVPTEVAPQSLMIDLGDGNEKKVDYYFIRARNQSNYGNPSDWKLQGTSSGIAAAADAETANGWTTIDERSGEPALGQAGLSDKYTTSGTEAYSKYRIRITARNQTYGWVAIGDLLMATSGNAPCGLCYSYAYNSTDKYASNTTASLIKLSAGDYIEVVARRQGTAGNAYVLQEGQTYIMMEFVRFGD